MMFIPTIGVVITRVATKEGFKNLWIRPNLKGNVKYYIFAWFGMVVLSIIGAIIYFIVFPGKFDANLSYMVSVYESAGKSITAQELKNVMWGQIAMGIFLAPILNALPCFGEEWAWRGYLLPKMSEKFELLPMLLINGLIWGLWHAPLTVMGHNYGIGYAGYPFTGIFAMCIFCIVMGTIFSYVTMKTKSCLPAVIAHGSLNGFAAAGIYFTADGGNPFVGPAPTGIVGGSAFIIMAVVLYFALKKDKSDKSDIMDSK